MAGFDPQPPLRVDRDDVPVVVGESDRPHGGQPNPGSVVHAGIRGPLEGRVRLLEGVAGQRGDRPLERYRRVRGIDGDRRKRLQQGDALG
jgi:hypothetical protein